MKQCVMITKFCKKCKGSFKTYKKAAIYCSWNCAWNRKQDKRCEHCFTPIKVYPSLMKRKRFCSLFCKQKGMMSENVRIKISQTLSKRFGGTDKVSSLRNMALWKIWSRKVKYRDGEVCQMCGTRKNLVSHHKKPADLFPELIYVVSNGVTVCRKCHPPRHEKDKKRCLLML